VARETKIGLVVGLGFIVCFAIILSNRGAARTPQLTYLYRPEMDALASPSPSTAAEPERRARSLGGGATREREVNSAKRGDEGFATRRQEVASAPPNDSSSTPLRSTTGAPEPLSAPFSASGETPPEMTRSPIASGGRTSQPPETVRGGAQSPSTWSGSPAITAAPQSPTSALQASDAGRALRRLPDGGAPAPGSLSASAVIECKHTVAKGDTLWKISEAYYGTKSRQIVDAIFEANRATLSDPERLELGQELALPVVSGLSAPALRPAVTADRGARPPDAAPAASETPQPPAQKPPKTPRNRSEPSRGGRLYEVKPGDRYASIAQSQLGDRNRWKEIYELNKDQVPDPTKIRTGTKIRLPGDEG
jgi:nucleoid-associated protein YgaU